MKKIVLLYLFAFVIGSIHCSGNCAINWETLSGHLLPDGKAKNIADSIFTQELLEAYLNDLEETAALFNEAGFTPLTKSYRISSHPLLPDFVFKLARRHPDECHPSPTSSVIERVLQAEMLRTLIKDLGLTRIIIPQKYLYRPPCVEAGLSDKNFICFAQKLDVLPIEENKKAIESLPEVTVQEVIALIKAVGFFDIHYENLCVLPDNKSVAFIDTEIIVPWFSTEDCVNWFNSLVSPEKTQECIEKFIGLVNQESGVTHECSQ